ncbi:hypothetical protein, partial [Salinimicrobium marinum]|uniref:hypothetical protein n=1 Tax=Salinimicrobium marinum TaxID=680283 RepID=UPI001E4B7E06
SLRIKTRMGKKAQFTTLYKNNAKTCLESKLLAYLPAMIFLRKIIAGNRRTVFIRDVACKLEKKRDKSRSGPLT